MTPDALVITGATATGKTALAIEVAERLRAEVVSMDSRQVYRGMDIGTAKPSLAERRGIAHHGFDLVDPHERYSAGRFARESRAWLTDIVSRGNVPILAGGTGFFLRALTDPLFREPAMDVERREALKRWLAGLPDTELLRWVERLDAAAAARGGGRQRLARAIEVALLSGRTLTWWHRHSPAEEPALEPLIFVLELPRVALYGRIEDRVDDMVEAGLVAEVQRLLARGFGEHDPGMNATGYVELIPHLTGSTSLVDAVSEIKAATRRYARRQLTWFRGQLATGVSRLDAGRPTSELAEIVASSWREGTKRKAER